MPFFFDQNIASTSAGLLGPTSPAEVSFLAKSNQFNVRWNESFLVELLLDFANGHLLQFIRSSTSWETIVLDEAGVEEDVVECLSI